MKNLSGGDFIYVEDKLERAGKVEEDVLEVILSPIEEIIFGIETIIEEVEKYQIIQPKCEQYSAIIHLEECLKLLKK